MTLRFISRQEYRNKQDPRFLQQLVHDLGPCHLVPEGGGDLLGAQGCQALGQALDKLRIADPFDAVCCAVGTGGTLAGLSAGLSGSIHVHGFSVLKGEGRLEREVRDLHSALGGGASWTLEGDFHCGGYARVPADLKAFIREFEAATGVLLDPVYTAKMMWGIACKARAGHWAANTRIVAVHSGGLQGRRGFNMNVPAGTNRP